MTRVHTRSITLVILLSIVFIASAYRTPKERAVSNPQTTTPEITIADLDQHIGYLSSEEVNGRLTGSPGEILAGNYLARVFEDIGLEPAGENGTFFQSFEFTAGVDLGTENSTTLLNGESIISEGAVNEDFRPLSFSSIGEESAPIVFAGYGLVAPESEEFEAYNSYQDIDISGKWALVFRFIPEDISAEKRRYLTRYSQLRRKALEVRGLGGRGIIVVSGPNSGVQQELVALTTDAAMTGMSISALSITDDFASKILEGTEHTLSSLQGELDTGAHVPSFEIPGITLRSNVDILQQRKTGRNVLARLSTNSNSPSSIIIGGHYDHLGVVEEGGGLANGGEPGEICYGADDNASGIAAMLEIAQNLSNKARTGEFNPAKSIIFAAWSGEELGLLGSSHYANSLLEGGAVYPRISTYLNMDMIGRLRGSLIMQGSGSSSIWQDELDQASRDLGIDVVLQSDPYLPTDSTSLYTKGVPILNAFTGTHDDYHTPADTIEKINFEGTLKVTILLTNLLTSLAESTEVPDYITVKRPNTGSGFRAVLGIIPDFSNTTIPGLRLNGVRAGGPADTVGMVAGDIIVELAGAAVTGIHDYTFALSALRVGEQVPVVILRDETRHTFYITPESKQ